VTPSELFTVPPGEFVAARNQLVKELKQAGEREQAAAVAGWRRPTNTDWALNVTADGHGDDVATFLEAADGARAAQAAAIEGRPGDDLRSAVGELRDAAGRLARAAEQVLARIGKTTAADVAAVTSRLAEVATNPELGVQLRERRLGSGAVEGYELFGGLEPARPSKGRAEAPASPPSPAQAKAAAKDKEAEREAGRARAAVERERKAARTAADRAANRVERAAADVATAEERLAAARSALDAAREEHDRLEQVAADADRAAEDLRSG
jgi:hypothetical protein